jgi:hemoglobin
VISAAFYTYNRMEEHEVFPVVGEAGFTRLVHSFYEAIPHNPILGPMYPADDLSGAEERLRNFLMYRFGGPATYIEERGHPRLRMRHAPFPVDQGAREQWLTLMAAALEQSEIPPEAKELLWSYFESTANAMINRP